MKLKNTLLVCEVKYVRKKWIQQQHFGKVNEYRVLIVKPQRRATKGGEKVLTKKKKKPVKAFNGSEDINF